MPKPTGTSLAARTHSSTQTHEPNTKATSPPCNRTFLCTRSFTVDPSTSSHHLSKQVRIVYCRASIVCRSCTVASRCCRMYLNLYACNDGGGCRRSHAPHSRPSFWIARTSASSAAMSAEQVQHTSHHRQAAHCMESQKHAVSLETASTSTVLLHEQTRMPKHNSHIVIADMITPFQGKLQLTETKQAFYVL